MNFNIQGAAHTVYTETIKSQELVSVEWLRPSRTAWFHLRDGRQTMLIGYGLKEVEDIAETLGRQLHQVDELSAVPSGPAGYAVAAVMEGLRKKS